ncbi:hypothetical protein SAMN05216359_1229 [Roseateles sp. YR242]|uniref:hypothetical protein n=1 Tax=Roseateles sp. YR242 TaxID=1855305 RepID=UPI0008C039D7|nr:hypothetical protein [Roseateles sp. YR242]SEL89157.1 hypothetical protein SAMN05216359_1229 [Roseateles sp. YR242]
MTALDSRLALALMAKAERVFGSPGQVLAFPLSGASYRAGQLNFLPTSTDAEVARAALGALSDFSSLVNTLPLGRAWEAGAGRADLPSVYRQVIEGAQIADPTESEADRQQLQAAQRLLISSNLDGSEVDTPVYAAYKRCRDTWLLASQQYSAAKASGELGADEAARQAWLFNEPVLKAAVDKALEDWRLAGHRNEVEEAQARIDALTQRAPVTQWHDWDLRSRRGVGSVADLTGQPFWPAYISPANACEVGWQRMVLTRGEVEALQASAPAEMKARLGAGSATLAVEQLQFEFTSAKLQRPWFDGEVFSARFWRPRPGSILQVSQGLEPFAGACPLYASAVVFFRRVRAVVQGETAAANSLGGQAGGLDLGLIQPTWTALKEVPPAQAGGAAPERVEEAPDELLHRGAIRPVALPAHLRMAPEHPSIGGLAAAVVEPPDPVGIAGIAGPGRARAAFRFSERDLVNRHLILRDVQWTPPVIQEPALPAGGTSVLATNDDDIFILAFICTAVPASPDPDPGLVWNPAG